VLALQVEVTFITGAGIKKRRDRSQSTHFFHFIGDDAWFQALPMTVAIETMCHHCFNFSNVPWKLL
jgi:hypothetical protein